MQNSNDYSVEAVRSVLAKNNEISFLNLTMFNDGSIAKAEADTFELEGGRHCGEPVSKLRLVLKDGKNRRDATYAKIGLTKEEVQNGLPGDEFSREVSFYFAEHPGLVSGYDVQKQIRAVNKILQENLFLPVVNEMLDVHSMSLYCKEACSKGSLKAIESTMESCMKAYARLERVGQNKVQCILKSVSYWECLIPNKSKLPGRKLFLFFRTSVGTIYYNILDEKWDMSSKERNRTGLMIESFDIGDVTQQAFRKYGVMDIRELEFKLRATSESKKSACAV